MCRRKPRPALASLLLLLLLLAAACGGSSSDQYLDEGDPAPGFELQTAQGGQVSLAQFQGKSPVLLYFHMAVG